MTSAAESAGSALPGISEIDATFNASCLPAYCDHWVSNVTSREGFLETLEETLGFNPKVDFNAGVVAAGEAQIESTVTGNTTIMETTESGEALKDHSQVYLPINNALSEVGHVHWFLEQIGQGVQHVANRVENLPAFIQRANNYREITGEGFTFLNIPRSYYGRLTVDDLKDLNLTKARIETLFERLRSRQLMNDAGVVKLDISDQELNLAIGELGDLEVQQQQDLSVVIKRSRYGNLYKLLRDHLGEDSYLQIVRNKILVDIQGGDLLYQIFTSNIMQRNTGEEAPFMEFIQRLCSEKRDETGACLPIKPGCGGFGIRNFLTLFLSIEVSKAMEELADAKARGDAKRETKAKQQIDLFTAQLDESNPILTKISDAMTLEGQLLEDAARATENSERQKILGRAKKQQALKEQGQDMLQECSRKYAKLMQSLRSQ